VYSLGTLFVSGIHVLIPCIKEIMMMMMIIIIIIIIIMEMMMIIIMMMMMMIINALFDSTIWAFQSISTKLSSKIFPLIKIQFSGNPGVI
jgi:sugar phosphate permease